MTNQIKVGRWTKKKDKSYRMKKAKKEADQTRERKQPERPIHVLNNKNEIIRVIMPDEPDYQKYK